MLFEKGRRTHHDLFINNTPIELVDHFKYLGITLFKKCNWFCTQKCIAQHASYALYNLCTVINAFELSASQKTQPV